MENIRSEIAFRQKYDTNPLNTVQKYGTDIDWLQHLPNGVWVVNEWKKNTSNHTPEEIIKSEQWAAIRKLAGQENYAIYSTHDEEISDKDISTDSLIVRYVELAGQPVEFKQGITLKKFENALGSVGMYYIKVKYANNKEEFALVSPSEGDSWTSAEYLSSKCAFSSEEACKAYIQKRYEKEFNRAYTYSVFHVESMSSVTVKHRYTYEEMIGL